MIGCNGLRETVFDVETAVGGSALPLFRHFGASLTILYKIGKIFSKGRWEGAVK